MSTPEQEEKLLQSVALQNMQSVLRARARAEEELLAAKEALRATFDQAAVGMAWASLEGRLTEVNQRFCAVLGYEPEELRRLTVRDITHPDDVAATEAEMARLRTGEVRDYRLEKRYLRRDGKVIWSWTTVTLVRNALGQPSRFIGVVDDITERKAAQEALAGESRMLELLNQTGLALGTNLELQQILQKVTDSATELSGAQFGAFFYNTVDENGKAFQLYVLSGAPREAFEKLGHPRATPIFAPTFNNEGIVRVADIRRDARYGQWAPHHGMPQGHLPVSSYLAVPVVSRAGEVIGGLFFGHPEPDVFTERTERLVAGIAAQAAVAIDNARLLESERAARTEAERASHMKDEFLATLSHELRTPLGAILGWAQLMRARPPSPEDLAKGLASIERNARVQTQLIEDLLDMSRITSGKLRLDTQPVMPASFIEAALETVHPAAQAKGIRLQRVIDPDAGPVSGDPARLQQIIWNLVNNAIKFTARGGRVQVVLARVNSHIEISVADDGIGIEPQFLTHVWERFRQADASTTRRFGGLGLGLSIVKHLTELHGGSVRAQSAGQGQGATFVVLLPLTAVHRASMQDARTHPRSAPASMVLDFEPLDLSGITALVVDDQPDACELVARVLGECGAQVITASSARQALQLLVDRRPDVLVSDIGMPEMDGYELIRRVRALDARGGGRTPAIAMTAFARSEDRTRALQSGFQVHLAKPVEPSELIATVASVVARER
ncbi:MAG: ATP-binding protein [Usitatibacter sp.]